MNKAGLLNLARILESEDGKTILSEILSLLQDKEMSLIRAIKLKPIEEGFTREAENVLNFTRGQVDILETLIRKTLNPVVLRQAIESIEPSASY